MLAWTRGLAEYSGMEAALEMAGQLAGVDRGELWEVWGCGCVSQEQPCVFLRKGVCTKALGGRQRALTWVLTAVLR